MNPGAMTCPTQQHLAAFAAGKLDAAFSGEIEQHLGECPSCCQLLKLLPDDNTLVSLLRDPRAETTADDPRPPSPGTAPTILPAREQLTTPPGAGATEFAGGSGGAEPLSLPDSLAHHARYRITKLLGRGGMGDVYQAHHRMMNRTVALKVISAQLVSSPAAIGRFHREVQAAARLSHPNIVTAYDAEQAGDTHFLVMEFVEGTDLATLVQQSGPLTVTEACDFIRQTAEGLQHAHSLGMVHRDIKPQNLMVAGTVIKILDFGLASFVTESAAEQIEHAPDQGVAAAAGAAQLTLMGSMMGTPDFMAPEQARDAHAADVRSDIYSLGCTLHFLLTGQPPFSGESVLDKVMAHVQREANPLSECRTDLPPGVEAVVRRMMAKDPAERFQTPAEVAAALAPFTQPAVAPPRRRTLRTLLAAAAAILLAGVVIYVTNDKGRVEIRSERDDVEFVILKNGAEIRAIDLQTGTQVTWLPSGEYDIVLRQGNDYIRLDQKGFKLSRWGKEIVTVKRETEMTKVESPANERDRDQEAWASELGVQVEFENSIGMKLRLIPPGEFQMGAPDTDSLAGQDEKPAHLVHLGKPFFIGVYEVTQGQFEAVMGRNPSFFQGGGGGGADHPVEQVTWDDAVAFCRKLTELAAEKNAGRTYLLPTEAQWEYACRAGAATPFSFGPTLSSHQANFDGRYILYGGNKGPFLNRTVPVGSYRANAFGLQDMHGNVWEWCADFYDEKYYEQSPRDDPSGPKSGEIHVLRGGCWLNSDRDCRASVRGANKTDQARKHEGFRVVCEVMDASANLQEKINVQPTSLERLQGKWVAVSAMFRGKELKAEQLARLSITLEGNRAEITDPDSGEAMAGTFSIDASRTPKHIDFIAPDGKERAPGIFEFDGERLKVAFVDADYARPADFEPAETPDHMTAVFERVPGSAPTTIPKDEPAAPLGLDETQREVVKSAEAYLAVMDEGRFGQLRDMLSSIAKRQTTREQMAQANQKFRDTFGKAQRRTLQRVQLYDEFSGMPEGRYAAVQYKSDFERQNGLWESLILNLDTDGQWRGITYANTLEPLPFPDTKEPAAGNRNQTQRAGLLTNPPKLPEGGLPVGKNLIVDHSLEDTPTGQLPEGWFAWLHDGPDFKCEVVEGGVTGKHCLQISGTGTRGVVFATSIPLDRTKRYAMKGRVKVEGEAGTWAVVKLNYFNSTGWLGADDRVGVMTSDFDWKLFEKTDAVDRYPAATLLVPTCHIEGNGTAWFDDLEMIAYDREKLPENFDATYGKNNRMK